MYKVLVTCPPMIKSIKDGHFPSGHNHMKLTLPEVKQILSEIELMNLLPEYDGWIIGDDPATEDVVKSGSQGRLRAAVKWGVGIDNVDIEAMKKYSVKFSHTPDMFGNEVADIALTYLIGLARRTYRIDREVRQGTWPKYTGVSLAGKIVGLVGYGDIGKQLAKRLLVLGMQVIAFDPQYNPSSIDKNVVLETWPAKLEHCDFLVFTCSLNDSNRKMLNDGTLAFCKNGVSIINVARGGLIDETALVKGLDDGRVSAVALDVMEYEPLPVESPLLRYEQNIFGSHNASNTYEAVSATSKLAIEKLVGLLNE